MSRPVALQGWFMPEMIVDYVVHQIGGQWTVVRRTFDAATIWLSHAPVSTHGAKSEAVAAMQRLNRPQRRMRRHRHVGRAQPAAAAN